MNYYISYDLSSFFSNSSCDLSNFFSNCRLLTESEIKSCMSKTGKNKKHVKKSKIKGYRGENND